MRRVPRALVYVGTIAVVLALGRFHAQFIGHYYLHSSSRLTATFGYMAVLALAAYGVGLPDLHRTFRGSLAASAVAVLAASFAISVISTFTATPLLPRFVVIGSAMLLVPWY